MINQSVELPTNQIYHLIEHYQLDNQHASFIPHVNFYNQVREQLEDFDPDIDNDLELYEHDDNDTSSENSTGVVSIPLNGTFIKALKRENDDYEVYYERAFRQLCKNLDYHMVLISSRDCGFLFDQQSIILPSYQGILKSHWTDRYVYLMKHITIMFTLCDFVLNKELRLLPSEERRFEKYIESVFESYQVFSKTIPHQVNEKILRIICSYQAEIERLVNTTLDNGVVSDINQANIDD